MKKVIIIDDEVDFCQLFKLMFEKRGFAVFMAHTMHDGLELIEKEDPGIIFIDNYLPDEKGWDVALRLFGQLKDKSINLISAMDSSFRNLKDINFTIWEKPITSMQIDNFCQFLSVGTENQSSIYPESDI